MNLTKIIAPIILIFIGIMVILNALTSSGANISALAKYFAIGSLLIGFVGSKFPFYLLIIYAATSDLFKRMLVLEESFNSLDITYILMMSPLLMLGIFSGHLARGLLARSITKLQWASVGIGLMLSILNFAVSGLSGGGGMGLLQQGSNVVSYFFLPFCVLAAFKNLNEYIPILKFTVWIFVPVAIHGILQSAIGYSGFEYDYLSSGYTTIVNWADIDKTRPFSTSSSPGAFAYVTGLLMCVCMLFSQAKRKVLTLGAKRIDWFPAFLSVSLGLILLFGSLASQSRTQIFVTLCIIPYFYLIKKTGPTLFAYLSVFSCTLCLFIFSGYILEYDLLVSYQKNISPVLVKITGADGRYFTLSTMHVRLEGWHNVMTNPEFHYPFGNAEIAEFKANASRQELKAAGLLSHDAFSSLLINIGWVPLMFTAVIGSYVLIKIHRWIASFPFKSLESRAARLGLLALFAGYLATLAGGALTAYPVCLVLNLVFSLTYLAYRSQKEFEVSTKEDPEWINHSESPATT